MTIFYGALAVIVVLLNGILVHRLCRPKVSERSSEVKVIKSGMEKTYKALCMECNSDLEVKGSDGKIDHGTLYFDCPVCGEDNELDFVPFPPGLRPDRKPSPDRSVCTFPGDFE